jgi:hypothetical protein
MLKVRTGFLIGVAVVLATSCSSGSSTPSAPASSAPVVTTAAYLIAANRICQTMNDKIQALPDPGNDPIKLADVGDSAQAIIRSSLQRLRALAVPPGQGAKIAAIYAKVDAGLSLAAQYSTALRTRNGALEQRLGPRVDAAQASANAAANAYGLTVCGS